MFSADSLPSLGQSLIDPYSLVASTVRSRCTWLAANHSPMISSVQPAWESSSVLICPGGLCLPP